MVEKYWKQFESSGKVEDYLSFVSHTRDIGDGEGGQVVQDEHAGTYLRDGNDIETDTHRGVRQTYHPLD